MATHRRPNIISPHPVRAKAAERGLNFASHPALLARRLRREKFSIKLCEIITCAGRRDGYHLLMARRALPKNTETAILVQSRRRCCICFGLDRDARLKAGQVAHLDKNNDNHAEANLAFLCFEHHDEYDSTSSQRKNFTAGEVREFRLELYRTINKGFAQPVHFGEITVSPSDPFAGAWIRIGSESDSAELTLTPLPDSHEGDLQYHVTGMALWGSERPNGPNLGTLEFVGIMTDRRQIVYRRRLCGDEFVTTTLAFSRDGTMDVTEENWIGAYGMNATFIGTYKRAS